MLIGEKYFQGERTGAFFGNRERNGSLAIEAAWREKKR